MAKAGETKKIFLDIYVAAHKNAFDLLQDAKVLFEKRRFASAYALGFTALEEISKSQLAADVYTGFTDEEHFKKVWLNHEKKMANVKWAHDDANSFAYNLKWIGPDADDVKPMTPDEPIFHKRKAALYVDADLNASAVSTPNEAVTEQDAEGIIHIVETALQRIWEVTEHWGHQIGTKGFMK